MGEKPLISGLSSKDTTVINMSRADPFTETANGYNWAFIIELICEILQIEPFLSNLIEEIRLS